jgi:hypothetical protein
VRVDFGGREIELRTKLRGHRTICSLFLAVKTGGREIEFFNGDL